MTLSKKSNITKYYPVCGSCKMPLGKKSKGYKCGFCGALFNNGHLLQSNIRGKM